MFTVFTDRANCCFSHHVSTLTTLGAEAEDAVERFFVEPSAL